MSEYFITWKYNRIRSYVVKFLIFFITTHLFDYFFLTAAFSSIYNSLKLNVGHHIAYDRQHITQPPTIPSPPVPMLVILDARCHGPISSKLNPMRDFVFDRVQPTYLGTAHTYIYIYIYLP